MMSRQRRQTAVRRAMSRRPRPSRTRARSDSGMVVLETAIAIPVLAAVAIALAWVVSIGGAALHLGDTVRSAARELARGESQEAVLGRARSEVPAADFVVAVDGARVVVSAHQRVAPPIPLLDGLAVAIKQQVDVPVEWP